ncbi:MAG: RimJ/RimL family protein N-acetyltransferase [Planctomycetota bacterium]|jgi:RimJ/RimL family protein N-acetyltransferase
MSLEFTFQPFLSDEKLAIRPITVDDLEPMYAIMSDKNIWAGHPASDRYQRPVFEQWFKNAIASKATIVVSDRATGALIGSSRYYTVATVPDDISIGFTFLTCAYWGGETNCQLKRLMFDYAFQFFDTIWLHASPDNIRSQKACEKIGAQFTHDEVSPISGKDELWFCYKVSKEQWQSLKQPASA